MQAEIDWLQQLGTPEYDKGNAVVVDSDNKYIYVGGYTKGALSDEGSTSSYWNPWVGKFYAKSGEQIWLKQLSYGEEYKKNSESRELAVDDEGVYVLIQIDTNDPSVADASGKAWVIKFNLDTGEQEWTYKFESESNVAKKTGSIVADGNGYLYVTGTVAGSMLSPDGDALETTGTLDTWIAKLSTDQELNWIVQFGSGESESYGMNLAIDGSSNVYAVGYTTGVMSDTNASNDSASKDAWVAKYDTDGNRQWIVQLGTEQDADDQANAVAIDDSGGVYAIGNTYGDFLGDSAVVPLTRWRTWVAKFKASSGEQVWLNQLTDIVDDGTRPDSPGTEGNGIAVDNYDNVYTAGSTDGQLAADASDPYWNDIWVAKYHAHTGEQVWLQQIPSQNKDIGDRAYDITLDPSGNLYLTGFTWGEISDIEAEEGSADIWVAQLREVPEDYDELAQVLKRYIDHTVSQSTETVLEASDTTTTTTSSISDTSSSLLEVAADVVASNGNTDEDEESTEESSISVLSVAAGLAGS